MAAFSIRIWRGLAAVVILCAMAGAASAETLRHRIDVVDAWVRRPNKISPEGKAFFTIVNHTELDERLVSVVSPGGEARIMLLHATLSPYVEEVQAITIPAHGAITLRPGEYYVVLGDSAESLRPGRSLALSLRFESAGSLDVRAGISNQLLGNMRKKAP